MNTMFRGTARCRMQIGSRNHFEVLFSCTIMGGLLPSYFDVHFRSRHLVFSSSGLQSQFSRLEDNKQLTEIYTQLVSTRDTW